MAKIVNLDANVFVAVADHRRLGVKYDPLFHSRQW